MRTHSFYTRFCLMMIQSAVLAGCTGGHKSRNSTASKNKTVAAPDLSKQTSGTQVIETKTNTDTNSAGTKTVDSSASTTAATDSSGSATAIGSAPSSAPAVNSTSTSGTTTTGATTSSSGATTSAPATTSTTPSAVPVVSATAQPAPQTKQEAKVEKKADSTTEAAAKAGTQQAATSEATAKAGTQQAVSTEAKAADVKTAQKTDDQAAKKADDQPAKTFVKLEGKLAGGSGYIGEKGEKNDLAGKACSLSIEEKDSTVLLEVKNGDIDQYLPFKKDQFDKYFVRLEKVEKEQSFNYFSKKPLILVMAILDNLDGTESKDEGILYNRASFVFLSDKITSEEQASAALKDISAKIVSDKDYKEVVFIQDTLRFVVKDKKIVSFQYLSRQAVPGTAQAAAEKEIRNSKFDVNAQFNCQISQ